MNCHEWDMYGIPGNFIYGDDVYSDDYYMDERWKRVRDFPDYWVSDMGRLYSTVTNRFVRGTPTGKCGHIDVSIKYGGERFHRYLHRMVAEVFIPNPHDYPIVRHLDDNPYNNCVDNLAWGTQIDNMRDAISNNTFRYFTDEAREIAMSIRRRPVLAIRLSDGLSIWFASQQEAARVLGVNQSTISHIVTGKSGRHSEHGYTFRYAEEGDYYE